MAHKTDGEIQVESEFLQKARERLRDLGTDSLTDGEILALFLGEDGHLPKGGLQVLETGHVGDLTYLGFSEGQAIRTIAAFEMARRVSSRPLRRDIPLRSSRDIARAWSGKIDDATFERVVVIVLSSNNLPLARVEVAKGDTDCCAVAVRTIFEAVVRNGGAGVVLIHNHPSGNEIPSPEDISFTRSIKSAADTLGFLLADHVIVTRDPDVYFSFLDAGLLE